MWSVPLSLVCTWVVPLPVCDHSQGVYFSPTQEAEYIFSGFILTNKQTNKQTNTHNYETYIQYQHTNTSLHNNIPHPTYHTNRQHTIKTTTHAQNTQQDKTQQQQKTTNNYNYKHTPNIQTHAQHTILPTYNHFQTTFLCPSSIAGVPSSQALPGFIITTPPSVCVPAVLGALAVWIQIKKNLLGGKKRYNLHH